MATRKPNKTPVKQRPVKIVEPSYDDLKEFLGDAARAWNNALCELQSHDEFDFVDAHFDADLNEFIKVAVYRHSSSDVVVFDSGDDD